MALGGNNTEEILAMIPTAAPEEDGEDPEGDGDSIGLENAMADLSVALSKNESRAAAMAFKRAIEIAIADLGV